MSGKKIYIILLMLVVASAGYFLFKWLQGSSAAWKYIPTNAAVVITSSHLQDSSYNATNIALDLKRLPLLDVASDNLSLLNLLTREKQKLHQFLKGKTITYSYHPRTSTEWGILMYIPIEKPEEAQWLSSPNNPAIRALHHNFQNHRLTDIYDSYSRPLFSYLIKDNYLIVSYFGDLIEDVIRTTSLNIQSFQLKSRFSKINDSNFGTNIYLKIESWKSVVPADQQRSTFTEFAKNFPSFQDFHIEEVLDKDKLTVRSTGTEAPEYYLTEWLRKVPGKIFSGHKHISQQTSYFYRFVSGDKDTFRKKYLKWHRGYKHEAWDKVNYHLGKDSKLLTENIGSELILCQLEENNSISDGKILLSEFSNYDKLRPLLHKLAKLSNADLNVSADKYQGYDIYAIPIPEFVAGLYGPMFSGFRSSYITYVAPYLVIANNSQVLQNYIVDYENHITWKELPEYDSVLTESGPNAQISMVVNLRKAQSQNEYRSSKTYNDLTSKIELATIQCRLEGDEAFPKITLYPKKNPTEIDLVNRTFLNIDVEWPNFYDSELSALQNPIDGSSEILLTDASNNLVRASDLTTGKTQTISKLDGPISTASYKVDFLNIGREQRILASKKMAYALDEDDSSKITRFAAPIPSSSDISALYLVDGGSDGSNRFIIQDEAQDLFLWENVIKPIRKLNHTVHFEKIQSPVIALNQIGNRGFIVTQNNGKIYLLKENGTVRPGFPVDILTRTESAFTWQQNTATGLPEIVGVSVSGELIKIGLDGKITSRRQLLRPEPGSRFKTLLDRNSLDWILVRKAFSKTAVLTKEGEEIFEIKDIQPNSLIQYHFFGIDNRFITIRSGSYTTVFDMNGKRLGDKPIPSEMPVQLAYQPGYFKVLIFSKSDKKVQVWSIKLR